MLTEHNNGDLVQRSAATRNRALIAAASLPLVILLTSVRVNSQSAGSCSLSIDHFEFTQGIQEGNGTAPLENSTGGVFPPPSVELIRNRATTVRAFISEPNGGDGCPKLPNGTFSIASISYVTHPSGSPVGFDTIAVSTAPGPRDLSPPWNRELFDSTINVDFVAKIPSNTNVMWFQLCISPSPSSTGAPPQGTGDCKTQTVSLLDRNKITMRGLRVDTKNPATSAPSAGFASEISKLIVPIWPLTSDSEYSLITKVAKYNGPSMVGDDFVQGEFLTFFVEDFLCRLSGTERADYLFAMLDEQAADPGNGVAGNRVSMIPVFENSGSPLENATVMMAHEFGHMSDTIHGHPEPDTAEEVGWDVLKAGKQFYPDPRVRSTQFDNVMKFDAKWDVWIASSSFLD